MGEMSGAVGLPLIGAALHPLLGWAIQRATKGGAGMVLLAAVNNIMTALIVVAYLRPGGGWAVSPMEWIAIANGFLFFFGQWFSVMSVKEGDLAVHSSVLGVKILIVALLSIGTGLEAGGWGLLAAVVLAAVAVFLVAGASLDGLKKHRKTVMLTVVACVFFGVNDFVTGRFGAEVGTARWISLMMGTSGVMSLFLLGSRADKLKAVVRDGSARWFVLLAGLCLGVQSLLVNIAFSEFSQPTLSNVVYSTRGVMAVIALCVFGGVAGKTHWGRRAFGSVLMLLALWVAL